MSRADPVKKAADALHVNAASNQLPIDIEGLANYVGAIVSYEPFNEELSGVLVKESDRIVIGVNSSHSKNRQRFTIAHEIGHLVLKHQGELFVDHVVMKRDGKSSKAIDRQEIEANRFAAELLMPEALVLERAHALESGKAGLSPDELISQLAKDFQVSSQAMEYRLTNLGVFMPQ